MILNRVELYARLPNIHGLILQKNTLILQLADQCVKCGLCLPHCPTYQLAFNENESPRGRIALLQGLAENCLMSDSHLQQHIDGCLLCRNCERVCPAGVRFGHIMDSGRTLLRKEKPISSTTAFLLSIPARPALMRFFNNTMHLYQASGLQWLVRYLNLLTFSRLGTAERLLPVLPYAKKLRKKYPARYQAKDCISLFIGCLGESFEQHTNKALLKLLTQLDYEVDVISQQTCCGALAAHAGDAQQAMHLAKKNIQAFSGRPTDIILYSATGCGAQLLEYANLPWSNKQEQKLAEAFVSRLEEVTCFLQRIDWPETISFYSLDKQVVVHEPCSQRNVLRQSDSATSLLQKIPQLNLSCLKNNEQCCGAAGTYMLTHAKQALALRQPKIASIREEKADIVVTTNPGCSLFLGAGLTGEKVRMVHPVVLLAEQLTIQGMSDE